MAVVNPSHGNSFNSAIVTSQNGTRFQVDAQYSGRFQGLVNDLDARGYQFSSSGINSGSGGFSDRATASGGTSAHASGLAIDINPGENPNSRNFQTTLPSDVGDIAARNGLAWGGADRFGNTDAMHFEVPGEQGSSVRSVGQYNGPDDYGKLSAYNQRAGFSTPLDPSTPPGKNDGQKKGDQTGDTTTTGQNQQTAKQKKPLTPGGKDDITGKAGAYQRTTTQSITSIMPTHEPWPGHPKSTEGPRQAVQGGSGNGGSGGSGGNNNNNNGTPSTVANSSPNGVKLAAFVSTMEASGSQNQADVMQSMINRSGQNYGGNGGLFGQVTARNQYAPISASMYGTTGGDNAAIRQYAGGTRVSTTELNGILAQDNWAEALQTRLGGGNAASARAVADDFNNNGPLSQSSSSFVGGRTDFRGTSVSSGADDISRGGSGANHFRPANQSKGASKLPPRADPGMNPNAANSAPTPANAASPSGSSPAPAAGTSTAPQAAAQTPTVPAISNFGLSGPKSS